MVLNTPYFWFDSGTAHTGGLTSHRDRYLLKNGTRVFGSSFLCSLRPAGAERKSGLLLNGTLVEG